MIPATAIVVTFDSAHARVSRCVAGRQHSRSSWSITARSDDTSAISGKARSHTSCAIYRDEGYGRADNAGRARRRQASSCSSSIPMSSLGDGAVAALIDAARALSRCGLLAPRIVEPSGRVFFQPRSLLASTLTNPVASLRCPTARHARRSSPAPVSSSVANSFCASAASIKTFLFYEDDDLCRRRG